MCPTPVCTEAPGLYLKLKKGSSGHRGTKSHQKSGRRLRWNSFISLIHVNCVTWCLDLLPGFWISYKGSWFVGVSLRGGEAGLPVLQFCWFDYSKLILFVIHEKCVLVIWMTKCIFLIFVWSSSLVPGSRAPQTPRISCVDSFKDVLWYVNEVTSKDGEWRLNQACLRN